MRREYGEPLKSNVSFVDGEAHYSDVLKQLGPPYKLSRMGDGMVFLYEHTILTENQIGIDIDYEHMPVLKIVVGHGKADGETAVMMFDEHGTLQSLDMDIWLRDLGWGSAVQLFFSVMSVTDPGGFNRTLDTNHWGAFLLNPHLAESLNRDSNLNLGANGVERVGSPVGAGHHSLEMPTYH